MVGRPLAAAGAGGGGGGGAALCDAQAVSSRARSKALGNRIVVLLPGEPGRLPRRRPGRTDQVRSIKRLAGSRARACRRPPPPALACAAGSATPASSLGPSSGREPPHKGVHVIVQTIAFKASGRLPPCRPAAKATARTAEARPGARHEEWPLRNGQLPLRSTLSWGVALICALELRCRSP